MNDWYLNSMLSFITLALKQKQEWYPTYSIPLKHIIKTGINRTCNRLVLLFRTVSVHFYFSDRHANIGKQTLWTPVRAAKDNKVYTSDNTLNNTNERRRKKKKHVKRYCFCVFLVNFLFCQTQFVRHEEVVAVQCSCWFMCLLIWNI
jgi:hypothetical protein